MRQDYQIENNEDSCEGNENQVTLQDDYNEGFVFLFFKTFQII